MKLRWALAALLTAYVLLAAPLTLAQPAWLSPGGYAEYRLHLGCPEGTGEALLLIKVVEVGPEGFILNTAIEHVKPESFIELLAPLEGETYVKYGDLEGQFYGAVGCNLTALMGSLKAEGFLVSKTNLTLAGYVYACYEVYGKTGQVEVKAWFQEDTGWPVSIYKRLYWYMRALELRRSGLSYNEIKSFLKSEVGYGPSKSELSYWLRDLKSPLRKVVVFDVRTPEVGFALGAILTDGSEYVHKFKGEMHGFRERFWNNNPMFLEVFKEICVKLGLKILSREDPPKLGGSVTRVEATSALLYLLLKHYSSFIIKTAREVQRAFIKAAFMGDGSNYKTFYNTDLELIKTIEDLLTIHGIEHYRGGPLPPRPPGKKPVYFIHIKAENLGL